MAPSNETVRGTAFLSASRRQQGSEEAFVPSRTPPIYSDWHYSASEGYFRMVYRDLIDFGDPYLRNSASFKDLSLGHEAIYAIHGKRTTIGEIIAHQLSHNNVGDITKNMDALTGGDFMAAVKRELDR